MVPTDFRKAEGEHENGTYKPLFLESIPVGACPSADAL